MTRVLVIEDEQMIAEDIKFILNNFNYDIIGDFTKEALGNYEELNGIDTNLEINKKGTQIVITFKESKLKTYSKIR